MKKLSCVVLSVLALSACSRYATNGEGSYLRSKNGAKIEVPRPLTDSNISDFYDLPAQDQDARVSIAPPGE